MELTSTCSLALSSKPCTAVLYLKYFTTSFPASTHSLICRWQWTYLVYLIALLQLQQYPDTCIWLMVDRSC